MTIVAIGGAVAVVSLGGGSPVHSQSASVVWGGHTPLSPALEGPVAMPLLDPHRNSQALPVGGGSLALADGVAVRQEALGDVPSAPATHGTITRYTVRPGDTLSHIARMFGVSVNTLRWANNLLRRDTIRPGQELLILPIDGVRYTVRSGDTLQAIARRFHGDVQEIVTFNGLDPSAPLRPGLALVIPGGEVPRAERQTGRATGVVRRSRGRLRVQYHREVAHMLHPVPGAVRSQGLHGWNAVDLAAPWGTPVRATLDGVVIVARARGWNGGYGRYIVLRHKDGIQTLYAHLSGVWVAVGQRVHRGETIGTVGSTGRSTGPHLHFEVRGARNPF